VHGHHFEPVKLAIERGSAAMLEQSRVLEMGIAGAVESFGRHAFDQHDPARNGGGPALAVETVENFLGVPIPFRVNVGDVGSDNLGVVWDWGDNTPFGIQVHEVSDNSLLCGGSNTVLDTNFDGIPTIFDGCEDGVFERVDNSDRTPTFDPVSVADVQSHAFTERYLFYVMVLTPDDDNSEGYPSTFLTDGVDMEFIMIDLR